MDEILKNLIIELRRGTQIIAVLINLKSPEYGYSLLQKLEEKNVQIEAGTLYPLLRRLESQGLLTFKWDTSDARPRKFYKLSESGEYILAELIKTWQDLTNEMNNIINDGGYL